MDEQKDVKTLKT